MGTGCGNALTLLPDDTYLMAAVDNCLEMVKRTRPYFPKVDFINSDALRLPCRDHSFDLILCIGLTEYIADPELLLSEINRVLDENGYLILTASPRNFITRFRLILGHRLFPRKEIVVRNYLEDKGFILVAKNKTVSQYQFLVQKQN